MPRDNILERSQLVPKPLPEVFAFFSDASNLEKLTPTFLRFEIITPLPIPMAEGTLIDYRIRLFGVPQKWRTLIEVWDPMRRFVDVQLRGPYAYWHHLHEFEEREGGTRISDRVTYRLRFGLLGTAVHALLVRRMLERIFDFRRQRVTELFG